MDARHIPDSPASKPSGLLAALGVVAGIGLLVAGLVFPRGSAPEAGGVVARVNGRPLSVTRLDGLARGINEERRAVGRPELERAEILERLIEEELLVDRAVELGLPYSDKIARGYLIHSLVNMITNEADQDIPSRETLEAFYQENATWFTPAGQVAAHFVFVRGQGDRERRRAEAIAEGWAALPPGEVPPADRMPIDVPRSLLPVAKLGDYLGSEAAGTLARLAVGQVCPPMPWMGGWLLARCTARTPARTPPFEEVETQVLKAYRARQAERDYRRYMDNLRAVADIRVPSGAP